jgi:hypothetical protein
MIKRYHRAVIENKIEKRTLVQMNVERRIQFEMKDAIPQNRNLGRSR